MRLRRSDDREWERTLDRLTRSSDSVPLSLSTGPQSWNAALQMWIEGKAKNFLDYFNSICLPGRVRGTVCTCHQVTVQKLDQQRI